jgi:hypothetical protein
LYLIEEEWDAWRKKSKAENHSGSSTGKGHGCGGSSSGGSLNKPTDDECRHSIKMGHRACQCRLKPKKEQAHVTATLTRLEASSMPGSVVEAISYGAEIELKEEKVYAHLDEEECDDGTWVLDTSVTNHKSGC